METEILTGEDIRFLAQQPDAEVGIMLGQMTTLMQNINDLQQDTDDKVAKLESQGWFKRMTNTLFGRNKATKQEIQKNNDKVVTYISQSVAQLYQMNMINERIICSLGNRMNEVYMQVTNMYQEQLNMKAQISQIMAVQQQTLETMGAFVSKLNEKIESVDNFHMLISEIQNGMYNDSSKLYNMCSILSQLDKRQMDDSRKMNLLRDTMERAGVITQEEFTVQKCLQEIVALPTEKIGLIYMELCNFRQSFPANLFADMIESYHFLSKMERMSKKKELIIQRVMDAYELDADAAFSVADIAESFFENKQECLVNISNIMIDTNNAPTTSEIDDTELLAKLNDFTYLSIINSGEEETADADQMFTEIELSRIEILAENGEPIAMYFIAHKLIGENDAKALDLLKASANKNYPPALLVMGAYWLGNGTDEDAVISDQHTANYDIAIDYFEKCSNDEKISGIIKTFCEDFEEIACALQELNDHKNAFRLRMICAKYGDLAAINMVALHYSAGKGVDQDFSKAFKYYKTAAEQGYPDSQNSLAICYMEGKGCIKDSEEALKWLKKAAEQGHALAQANLATQYYNGDGCEENHFEAFMWYEKAAEQGYVTAQFNLAVLYDNGDGCEENLYEAFKWYKKAAEQGYVTAQFNLAVLYENGDGCEENHYEAFKWYKKAAEQGHVTAQFNLADCYHNGEGCELDFKEAFKWYKKAAMQGNVDAQIELAYFYQNGFGCEKNKKAAMYWRQKAAEHDD
jgi:hypothetical protein